MFGVAPLTCGIAPTVTLWPVEVNVAMRPVTAVPVGTVAEIVPNPANDLWVARDDDGLETMVPALRDVIVEVDVAGRRILVRDVPGLTTPEDGAS